jgi:adenosylcobinamide-GDP ribazoletransferase
MVASIGEDIRACMRFYSRLPVGPGRDGHAMRDFAQASWATPVAGALIGLIGGGAALLASLLHLPNLVSATLAVGALALATGALHEDGLADLADGFGGGATREQKLTIMRDSRLGAYGALTLCVATLLRVAAVEEMLGRGLFLAAFAIVAASALSRVAGLLPLVTLLPARADGAGFCAATPSVSTMRRAFYIAGFIGLAPLLGGASVGQTVVAQMASVVAAMGIVKLAQREIGGFTGDVLGAAQQAAEIAALIVYSAA